MKLNLSDNIRIYRKRLTLTQEQLAERLGVSFQSVSRWENGTTVPDIELIVAMARLFGCTVDALLGCAAESEKPTLDEIDQLLEKAYAEKNRDEILRLLRLIRWEYCEKLDERGEIFVLQRLAYSGAYKLPGVLEEFRLLVKEFLPRMHNSACRADLIVTMARIETDEYAFDFIRDNDSGVWDITPDALMHERYRFREEWEDYRRVDLIQRYRKLCSFLMPDSEHTLSAETAEVRLAVLDVLCPMNPDCRGADIWAGIRLRLESACAKAYAEAGRREECLVMLERIADRVEALAALPEYSVLPCYTPEFADVPLMIDTLRGTDGEVILTEITFYEAMSPKPYNNAGCDMYQIWSYAHEMENAVFDFLREEPRFRTALVRMKNAAEQNKRNQINKRRKYEVFS